MIADGAFLFGCNFPAFNGREGLVISTVTYNDDGEVRPIMYRMSLAEMVVPYAAPGVHLSSSMLRTEGLTALKTCRTPSSS
jgi:Cu2+-containing amine oxidase